ncbi:response regulator transcription factor [Metaclostridioides mangenotii]|uniref:response regulator transcription factor n=1 Tax=Metaclostridioides mangenotii TaxID=1540 RepID=UPI0028E6196E|nr:response regulator transcription factor [Clostridioides mangenotii]
MKYKILVIDDEVSIVSLLKDFFELENFIVYIAYDGENALKKIDINPDIILLDINMPKIDGIEICAKIRNFVSCPILFLTAKVEERDKIKGFAVGGDDYITKPFSLEELNARVKAHLRRVERKNVKEKVKFLKDIVINYSDRKAFYRANEINFTKTEFDILEILSMNSGQIFSKENIYEKLWGFNKDGDSSIITEHIRRIRMKFSKYTDDIIIETVWGVGYKWIG